MAPVSNTLDFDEVARLETSSIWQMADEETTPLLKNGESVSEDTLAYNENSNPSAGSGARHEDPETEVINNGGLTVKPTVNLATIAMPLAVGVFLSAMDGTIVVSSYASIGSELNQLQNTSWIATGYMLTITSFQPLYGKLSDIFGRKPCLLFAYTVFSLGCIFCGLARSMSALIAARAFAGVGGGGMTTIASIIMSDVVPLRSRGTWQGIMNIVFATGAACGAPIGGLLADSIGWRWSFLMQVPLTILAILAVTFFLDLPRPEGSGSDVWKNFQRVDFAGALTLVLSVFFLLFGLDRGGNVSWTDLPTVSSLAAFFIFIVLFATIEMKLASEPFAPRRIIVNRALIASYLVNLFGNAAGMTGVFHVSLYFQAVRGKTAAEAGLLLLPSIIGGVVGSLAGGLTMQVTGKYYFLTVGGYIAMIVGITITNLSTGVVARSLVGVCIGLSLSAVGHGNGITTSLIALIANAGPDDQAIATAVSYLFRSLGSVVGLSIGSTLFQDSLRSYLRSKLSGPDVDEIIRRVRESLDYVNRLDPATRAIVRESYEEAIHNTLWFTASMAALSAVSAAFIKEKALPRRG